jgi:hypothetical protein
MQRSSSFRYVNVSVSANLGHSTRVIKLGNYHGTYPIAGKW